MLNEFLDILKRGYTVEFSESNTLSMTEITVTKNGKRASHSVNLSHLEDFGLTKEIAIIVLVRQLVVNIDAYITNPIMREVSE